MKKVFTDGSASPNPGPGGFAVIDAETGEPVILGRSNKTTNIVMEGMAIGCAISKVDDISEIYTDSEFWINVLTKWAPTWEENGWKKKGGIKNLELVKRLYAVYTSSKVKLIYTRGHVGTEMNEKADEWANKARKKETFKDLEIIEVKPIEKEDE